MYSLKIINDSTFILEIEVIANYHHKSWNPFLAKYLPPDNNVMKLSSLHPFYPNKMKAYSLSSLDYITISIFYKEKKIREDTFVRGGVWIITNSSLNISNDLSLKDSVDISNDLSVKDSMNIYTVLLSYNLCILFFRQ